MFSSRQSSQKQSNVLNQPLSLEKGRPPKVISGTLYSLSALAIGGIAWASITDIRELTSAPGQIMPIGQVNNVQHLEGGIVAEILLKEGAFVKEGDPIIRLAPISASADSDQVKNRSATLQMTMIRLDAQAVSKKPDLAKFMKDFPKLVTQQMSLWEADENARGKERDTLNTRIRQREQEIVTFKAEEEMLVKQLAIANEQYNIQEGLVKQGYTSKKTYLDSKSAMQKSESDLISIRGRIASAKESLKEAEGLYAEMAASVARKIADERSKAYSEYAEISGQVDKQSDRMERLLVRATSSGIIHEITPKVTGEILRPSEVAVKIVPAGQELVAEVRIDPKDIGHIQPGAKVEVKYSTFDPAMFGFSTGVVQKISATTFLPASTATPVPGPDGQMKNDPYYKAIVKLDSMFVGEGKFKRPVSTGMIITADIITGTKSLTRYMLKPVARSLDKAFSER